MANELAIRDSFDLPNQLQVTGQLRAIEEFRHLVHTNLVKDVDYGTIQGTPRPTLLKPGAEKIVKLLRCADTYEIMEQAKDWDKPLFSFLIRCRLIWMETGEVVSEGLGECNSYEAKYRWRNKQRECPECGGETVIVGKPEFGGGFLCWARKGGCGAKFVDGDRRITQQQLGRVENEDVFSQVNTILKMARKRALVDAALSAGRLSDIFTQDMEELAPAAAQAEPEREPKPKAAPARRREASLKSPGAPPPAKGDGLATAGESRFADLGSLMTVLARDFPGHPTQEFCNLLKVENIGDITDRDAAYAAAAAAWGPGS